MKNNKNIPPRNYLIAFFLIMITIIGTNYFLKWRDFKLDKLVSESYLIKTDTVSLTINTIEELENALIEIPRDVFIFTGYTGDYEEYQLEKNLKPIIDNYSLSNQFYYLDITELMDDDNNLKELSILLNTEINNYPVIIYISDDNYVNRIESKDEIIKAEDFLKLLEIYEFKKSK